MNEELDEEIRENYRKMASEALIVIVQNVEDDYTERAVEMATAELQARGIREIPPPAAEEEAPVEPPPEEAEDLDLSRSLVLREYGDELEAETALLWLAAENIRAFIWQDDRGEEGPGPRPQTGIRLAVLEDDREAAEDILQAFEADPGD